MTEAGDTLKSALERNAKAVESARQTAADIDAQRERDRAAGVAALPPQTPATPVETKQ